MTVSVIIPTYNRAKYVTKAIDSILAQTYKDYEIIVVDDGSTDHTPEVLKKYGDKIRVIRQENSGPSAARNYGIKMAKGSLVTFLDSDDLWLPTKIERQVAFLKCVDESVPCCLCNAIIRDNDCDEVLSFDLASIAPNYNEGLWTNVTQILATRCIFFTQAVAIRREALLKVGGFDGNLWILEDHDLALRLSLEGPWGYISDPLVIYNRNTLDSLSSEANKKNILVYEAWILLHRNILSEPQLPRNRVRRQLEKNLKVTLFRLRIFKASERGLFGASMRNKVFRLKESIKAALYLRSPWFHKIQDVPVKNSTLIEP